MTRTGSRRTLLEADLLDGFFTIEEIIEDAIRRDPKFKQQLAEARKRLAPMLFPVGSRSYERMMKGLPPPKIRWT